MMAADLNVQITREVGASHAKLTPRVLQATKGSSVSWGNNDSAGIRHRIWKLEAGSDNPEERLTNSFRKGAGSAPFYIVTVPIRYASFEQSPSGELPTTRISAIGEVEVL